MAGNGRMAGNDWKWQERLEMAGHDCNTRHVLKWLHVAGNCLKWLEIAKIARCGFRLLQMAENGGNGCTWQ